MTAKKTAPAAPAKTTARKPAAKKPTPTKPTPAKKPTPPTTPAGFIDAALMERAIVLRGEGKSMKAIGEELSVKATGYLARKIKATYGADALALPTKKEG